MVEIEGLYYLYRHIRLDNNEVFYIGIGKKRTKCKSYESLYERAYTDVSRNPFWKNVISKTNYDIEIILESNDLNFIRDKEIEFINLYKRRDCCEGSLVNLTDGGEGFNSSHTEDSKNKMKFTKNLIKETKKKEISKYVLEKYKTGSTINDLCKEFKVGKNIISEILQPVIRNAAFYKYKNYYIYNFSTNLITEVFGDLKEISKQSGICINSVKNHINPICKIRDRGKLILNDKISIMDAKDLYNMKVKNKTK